MTKAVINMTIWDADHYTDEQKRDIIAGYAEHERDARAFGVPVMGSGRVFPVPEESIKTPAIEIPHHWYHLGALDFGWDHPTAAVRLVHDRDADVVYVTHCYRVKQQTPILHAAALKPWGKDMRWAWPHDGLQHDKQSGIQLAEAYRDQGLRMMDERAQFPDDRGSGVEAGVMEMLDRMQTERFKVFDHLNDWFEEFRLYHRKDGLIVKERDDLMAATRYGIMELRNATPVNRPSRPIKYDSRGIV